MKFKAGDPVFFFDMFIRVPGTILSGCEDGDGRYVYEVESCHTKKVKVVTEDKISIRTITGEHKYNKGDEVKATVDGAEVIGKIIVVDAYGTLGQEEEPSYDLIGEGDALYKHVRESQVIGLVNV